MKMKEFKNGNFNVKKDLLYDGEVGGIIRMIALILLSNKDFIMSDENEEEISEYMRDNIEEIEKRVSKFKQCERMGYIWYELYNSKTCYFYRIDLNDAIKFDQGKLVKLIGRFV